MPKAPPALADIHGAKVLAILGDSVTTDHISPAGSIPVESPAGKYLIAKGVKPHEFNSYGARRGNHEVMMRGTFGNIRLRNQLAPGTEGGWTLFLPDGEKMAIYDAAVKYREAGVPLSFLPEKNMVPVLRAIGRRKARGYWASARSSPKATNASTAATSSAWACSRWNSSMVKIAKRLA